MCKIECAYAYDSLCKCWLYTVHPRQCVSHHLVVSDLPRSVVEEDDRAPDPVDIVLNTPHNESNCEENSDILGIGMNIRVNNLML